jgi:hypothetical protein
MADKRTVHYLKAMSFILGVCKVMATKTKETENLLNNLILANFTTTKKKLLSNSFPLSGE